MVGGVTPSEVEEKVASGWCYLCRKSSKDGGVVAGGELRCIAQQLNFWVRRSYYDLFIRPFVNNTNAGVSETTNLEPPNGLR
jgi:hypothetical protein